MPANLEHDLLLVTCASGNQASHLLPQLHGKWKNLRLAVCSADSENRLRAQYPHAQVVRGDLMDRAFIKSIMKGVASVFYIGPGFHPHEETFGFDVIDAALEEAKSGSLKHFVYSSVLQPILSKMLNHDSKRKVEEYLIESGLNYSTLQPAHFMDMFPIAKLAKQDEPVVYPANWDPSIPFSFTVLRDLGEAAAKVLVERETHYFAQYPLVSTDSPMSYTELIQRSSKIVGKEIKVQQKPYADAIDSMLLRLWGTTDAPARTRDGAERMLLFYNRRGLIGNSNVLEWLLGRKPTSHEDWARLKLAEVK